MKTMLGKIGLLLSGILTLVGINTTLTQATINYNKHTAEVRQTTPLYLKLGIYSPWLTNKDKKDLNLVWHMSHFSHGSHGSHYSHDNHGSHFSHDNHHSHYSG